MSQRQGRFVSARALVRDAEFAAGLVRRKPFQVLVQLTNRCNMKCSFCDFWPNPAAKRDELSTDEYRRVARELSDLGCFLVSIEGGEPFARTDLLEIVAAFGERHLPSLFTNGWYVTRDNAADLFAAGLAHASVSIDYPDATRHDRKRVAPGAFDRACRALEHLLAAAPRGAKQVHIMSVLMEDNWRDFDALFQLSARLGVGHQVTLLSLGGYRRGKGGPDAMPPVGVSEHMRSLWERYPHVQFFGEYFSRIDAFLTGGPMPGCKAGIQSFNIDHVGNVSPCIEKIDKIAGNVRTDHLAAIHARMVADRAGIEGCQECWTACRGIGQALGDGGSPAAWFDLATRMRSS
jgi:MoaA/NifB/PqqE/SkfB family radical SAM enzyme